MSVITERRPPEPAALLDGLNASQRAAAVFGIGDESDDRDRPLLVIVGARSGKTNMLAHRVAHLRARGVDAYSIMLLTFSRRAADEMTRRVARIAGQSAQRRAHPGRRGRSRTKRRIAGRTGGTGRYAQCLAGILRADWCQRTPRRVVAGNIRTGLPMV